MLAKLLIPLATLAAATFQASDALWLPSTSHLQVRSVPNPRHSLGDLWRRDAYNLLYGDDNNEGEDHSDPEVPDGSVLTTLNVGKDADTQLAVYWDEDPNDDAAPQVYIMIHGRLRDGYEYWQIMRDALDDAVEADHPHASANSIVVAPQFYSTKYNSGQYNSTTMAWADVNAWQAGEEANHPEDAGKTSFDALDQFVTEFSDTDKYPSMARINFVGHGGGGQLINRYAQIAANAPDGIEIRYIIGDPSSSAYYTKHRPLTDDTIATKDDCEMYNTWRYGFTNYTEDTGKDEEAAKDIFAQHVTRDVRYIVAYNDTDASGDQSCMALLQGGVARRDRNLAWWKYINLLAGTDEDVSDFPGNFTDLPDWSDLSDGSLAHTLTVVEGATHDASEVFGSDLGRSVLFNNANIPEGYRPGDD